MISILLVVISFGILILVHEFGHFIVAKLMGVTVETFSLGMGPKLISRKFGGTEYVISAIPLGGYVKMLGEDSADAKAKDPGEFMSKKPWQRFLVLVSGAFLNYVLAFVLFSAVFMIGYPGMGTTVGTMVDKMPAKESGLIKENDKILTVDGKSVRFWEDMVESIQNANTGKPINLLIDRGGNQVTVHIIPKISEGKNIFGKTLRLGKIGIGPKDELVKLKYGFFESFYYGYERLIKLTVITYKGIWYLFTGGIPVKESVAGPVGIFVITKKAADLGFVYLMIIMANINLAIAVFNLLPFPILDGGQVLFLGIEKLRRKPMSKKAYEFIINASWALIIGFVLFVTWNDIIRIFTNKLW